MGRFPAHFAAGQAALSIGGYSPCPTPTAPRTPAQPEEARTPQGEASPPPAEAKEKKPGAFGADVYTWLQALVVALTVLLLFFTFFGRVIGVDGHSMDPHLERRRPPLPPVRRL